MNGELLIIFLLQQAPKDGLKGGSNKALTQLKIVRKYSWAAPTRQTKGELEIRASVYAGELEMKFLVLSLYLHTRGSSACLM